MKTKTLALIVCFIAYFNSFSQDIITKKSGEKLEVIINSAIKKANELKHEYLTLEAMFLAMMEDSQALEVIKGCEADPLQIETELRDFLNQEGLFHRLIHKTGDQGQVAIYSRLTGHGHQLHNSSRNNIYFAL